MLDIKNIAKYEIIGLEAEVIDSKNKSDIGISGRILDETKHTIVIEHNGKKKILFKNNITIKIKIGNQAITIEGKILSGRPKERIKK